MSSATILTIAYLLAFVASFLGSLIMIIAEFLERKFTGKTETYNLAIAYYKFRKIESAFVDENTKKRLNKIIHFVYYTFWGIILPLVIFLLVPDNIQNSGTAVAFWFLVLIIFVYFLIVHLQHLALLSFYVDRENPFWKWGIKANVILALEKLLFSVTAVLSFLFLSAGFVFIFA